MALSGFLLDIGKSKISKDILNKPALLNDQKMTTMHDHVYYGPKALLKMGIPDPIVISKGQHHERLDGYSYPEDLRGDEITKFGRMIAILDTYDAIMADQYYKLGLSLKKHLKI